jgi:hypothetical protein
MNELVLLTFTEELCEAAQRYAESLLHQTPAEQEQARAKLKEAYTHLYYYQSNS